MQTPTKEQIETLIKQVSSQEGEQDMVAAVGGLLKATRDSEIVRANATALIRPMLESVTLAGLNPTAAKKVVFYGFYLGMLYKEQYGAPDISSEMLNKLIKLEEQ